MLEWLTGAYNWPYLFTLAVAGCFIMLEIMSGGLHHLSDIVTTDLDHDVSHDVLDWLGVGLVPVSIVFEVLFVFFGIIGLVSNAVVDAFVPTALLYVLMPLTIAVSAVGSAFVTRKVVRIIMRHMPADVATTTRRPGHFVDETGVVVRTVTRTTGQIRVSNTYLNCYSAESCVDAIAPGTHVSIDAYIADKNAYIVRPVEEGNTQGE